MNLSLVDFFLFIECGYVAFMVAAMVIGVRVRDKAKQNRALIIVSFVLHAIFFAGTMTYYFVGPEFNHQGFPTDAHNSVPTPLH